MSRRTRIAVGAAGVALALALAVAIVTGFDDPDPGSTGAAVATQSDAPTCLPEGAIDRKPSVVYRDPVGDAQDGHGDIRTVEVSESSDVTTIEAVVANLRETDAVVASFDTDCDGRDDFVLRVWNDGSTYLSQLSEEGVPITDVPASTTRQGSTYTTRFETYEINRSTAFRFRMRVDTEEYEEHADLAPDAASDPWLYGGARA
jgi:hypothetical protein